MLWPVSPRSSPACLPVPIRRLVALPRVYAGPSAYDSPREHVRGVVRSTPIHANPSSWLLGRLQTTAPRGCQNLLTTSPPVWSSTIMSASTGTYWEVPCERYSARSKLTWRSMSPCDSMLKKQRCLSIFRCCLRIPEAGRGTSLGRVANSDLFLDTHTHACEEGRCGGRRSSPCSTQALRNEAHARQH